MKRIIILTMIGILLFCFSGCSKADNISTLDPGGAASAADEPLPDVIENEGKTVKLTRINDRLWVHTTSAKYNGVDTPSNGMLAVSSKELILIDTPWTCEQTKDLLDLARKAFEKDCTLAVITHAHEDRIGGIDTLLENSIHTISTSLTAKMAEKQGYKKPTPEIPMDTPYNLVSGDLKAEIGYYGGGHTCDNIVVWFPDDKVLFGGCLVKGKAATQIGNTAEASMEQWPATLRTVLQKYGAANAVIPGHGDWGGTELIDNTLSLIEAAQNKK